MATRVLGVQYAGSWSDLRSLIRQWGAPRGVQVKVSATDYVGGSFDVEFVLENGNVSEDEAGRWVATALAHVKV